MTMASDRIVTLSSLSVVFALLVLDCSGGKIFMQQISQGVTSSDDMSGEVISHMGYRYNTNHHYLPNVDKTFTVTGLSTDIVYCLLLEFERFSVSNSYIVANSRYGERHYVAAQCESGDVLLIKERRYCNSPDYRPQTGSRFSQLVSNADSISFRFRTDFYYISTGFSFKYTVAAAIQDSANTNNHFSLTQASGFIASHGEYANSLYAENVVAALPIHHPYLLTLNRVTIRFISFDLDDNYCGDNLEIEGLIGYYNQPKIHKYCEATASSTNAGRPDPGRDITFLNLGDPLLFRFTSDSYYDYSAAQHQQSSKGFLLKYEVTDVGCSTERLRVYIYDSINTQDSTTNSIQATCYLGGHQIDTLICNTGIWTVSGFPGNASVCYQALNAQPVMIRDNQYPESVTEDKEGYIVSHSSYPEYYSPNIHSSLTIRGLMRSQRISITFYSFNIQGSCHGSSLSIQGIRETIVYSSCKQPLINDPITLVTSENSLTFRFSTDSTLTATGTGFFFRYTVLGTLLPSTKIQSLPTIRPWSSTEPTKVTQTTTSKSSVPLPGSLTVDGDLKPDFLEKTTSVPGYNSLSDGTVVGMIIGASVLVITVMIVVAVLLWRRRQNKMPPSVPTEENSNRNNNRTVVQMSALNSDPDDEEYYYLPEGTPVYQENNAINEEREILGRPRVDNSEYSVAEEVTTPVPAPRQRGVAATGYCATSSSQARGGHYDIADEYQLAGPTGDEYENFESVQRADQDREITDEYAVVSAATKKSRSRPACEATELVENDLYNT